MAFSDVSGASSHFSQAYEGFSTTTSGTTASGATTVGLNSVSGLTNGTVFVGVIEPAGVKEQIFTGVVDTAGSQITGVVWVKGSNVEHATGVTVVDYDVGAHHNLTTKGILVSHNQSGTPKAGITYPASTFTSPTIADFTNAQHTHASAGQGGQIANSGISGVSSEKLSNPYKFSVYRSSAWTTANGSFGKVQFDSELYDTGSNYDNATNYRFTAPIAGFYQFNASVYLNCSANAGYIIALRKNGLDVAVGSGGVPAQAFSCGWPISALLQLAATDYVEVYFYSNGVAGGTGAAQVYFNGFLVSGT